MEIIKKITDKDIVGSEGMSQAKPKISSRAVLFDHDGKIALMHVKSKSAYSIPGGGVEEGETLVDGLMREILEETGCKCRVVEAIGCISENRSQHDFTHLNYYYLAEVEGEKGTPALTEKEKENGNEVMWFEPKEAERILSMQEPINYQFSFIQRRDIEILQYLNHSSSKAAKEYARMIVKE